MKKLSQERITALTYAREKGYGTTGGRISDLSFYKKEVNLIGLAEALGYKLNTSKTGRSLSYTYRYVTMDLPDPSRPNDPKAFEDRIIISKNKEGAFQYYSVYGGDAFSKGSCFDLIQRTKGCAFDEAITFADKHIHKNGLGSKGITLDTTDISKVDLERELKDFYNVKPISKEQLSFVSSSRGISMETLESPLFKGQIMESLYTKDTGETFTNIAYPLRGKNNLSTYFLPPSEGEGNLVQAFDVHTRSARKFTEHLSSGAMWRSNIDNTKPVDIAFIGEAPIDCISHYEMHKEALRGMNVIYFASAGSLQQSHVETMNALMKGIRSTYNGQPIEMKPKELRTLFDRDTYGGKFTAQVLAGLDSPRGSGVLEGAKIHPVTHKDGSASVEFQFADGTKEENAQRANLLAKTLHSFSENSPYESSYASRFSLSLSSNDIGGSNQAAVCTCKFHPTAFNWNLVNGFIAKHKFGENPLVKQEVPVLKDFNDDLKALKGIGKVSPEDFKSATNRYNAFAELHRKHFGFKPRVGTPELTLAAPKKKGMAL